MALDEITPQSTSDEVKDYAAQVVEEVQAERAGEKKPEAKSDAQITAEHAKPAKETPLAEKKSGDKVKAEKSVASEKPAKTEKVEAEEAGEESWLDEGLKAEASAYGIEESELSDFASREEFERALRLFDKSAMEAGRAALAEADDEPKEEVEPKVEKKESPASSGKFEITLNKDVYDEEIVKQFNDLRDHYESRLEALESRFAESDARAEEQRFDSLVDSLGHSELFGKTDEEDEKQLQRRIDLYTAVKAQMIGLSTLGRPTDLNESLVGRVARMVFAEELGKKDIKNLTRRISRQSEKRQGAGATRPTDPREDPRDEADRLYKELSGAN